VGLSVYQQLACECMAGRDATNLKDEQAELRERANGKVSISNLQSIYLINKHERAKKLKDVCKQHMACEAPNSRDELFLSSAIERGNIILMRLV
jgi:hypothetical protein